MLVKSSVVFVLRMNNVPSFFIVSALYHFRSVSNGKTHGFASIDERFIDWAEGSIACDKCAEIMLAIDEARDTQRRGSEERATEPKGRA